MQRKQDRAYHSKTFYQVQDAVVWCGSKGPEGFERFEKNFYRGGIKWHLRERTDAGEGVDIVRELGLMVVINQKGPNGLSLAQGSCHCNQPWG